MNKDKELVNQQNLFSIASKEIEEEKSNNVENSEIQKKDESEISFGNLFHSVEQSEENNLNINSILKMDEAPEMTNQIEESNLSTNMGMNAFLQNNEVEERKDEINLFTSSEIQKEIEETQTPEITNQIEESNLSANMGMNAFLQNNEVEEIKDEMNLFASPEPQEETAELQTPEISNQIEESTQNVNLDTNPFVQNNEVEEINPFVSTETQEETAEPKTSEISNQIEESTQNVNLDTNPFVQNNEAKEIKEEVNPFVISSEPQEETAEPKTSEIINQIEKSTQNVNLDTNPFVQNDEVEEINPFVSTETQEEITEPQPLEVNNQPEELTPPVNLDTNPFVQNDEAKEIKEEVNPFFQNNVVAESTETINPFFNNKIELNENNNYQNKNNEKLELSGVPHYNVKVEKKKPKKSKMIIGVLSYALFIFLLLIGITLLIYVANIKIKEMKGDFTPPKYNAYVVLTGSMLPQIQVEDVVVTKKVEAENLKEGDIITFASSDERYYGTIITHRILKKYYDSTTQKYTFQSKGDNNNVADNALVEEDKIYGKVILKIPKLGYLQVFLASKGGWILVILLPCAAVISFDIMKLFKMIAMKRKLKIVK